ncbi:MAG: phosphatase [Clostridia bacterium]|nr:phosphatase [Clostridia bacterium]
MEYETEQAVKQAQRAYYAEWRKKNPEKVKAAQMRFWKKQIEKKQQDMRDEDGSKCKNTL